MNRIMEARAIGRYQHQSPRKIRMAADLIRGKDLEVALNLLHFSNKKSANLVEKVLRSAVANLLNTTAGASTNPEDLYVKSVWIDPGPMVKRYRAGSMGRANIIRRRQSHITVVVTEKPGAAKRKTKEKLNKTK